MKNIIVVLLSSLLFSCSTKKTEIQNNGSVSERQPELEYKITNDFLAVELKRERYKPYKHFELVVIEEVVKKARSINAYEYSYTNFYKNEKERDYWILDSMQIKKIQSAVASEKQLYWKKSDFKTINVTLLKYEELRTIINTGAYVNFPKRLLLFLSKPLIIDQNNAFISFDIGNGTSGNNAITHFTVLMEKQGTRWLAKGYFEDGVFY